MTGLISSAANPVVKRMRLLGDRKHRRREGAFVVEGIQPVWQAVDAGADVEVLVVAPELLDASPAAGMVAEQEAAGVRVARLTGELFARVSARDGPSGLAAIVRGRVPGLASLPVTPDAVFVALHEIGNPGNLGTIVRTADAAGGTGVVLIGAAADPFDPAAVKASMGALFAVPVARAADPAEFFAWAAGSAVTVVTTSAKARTSFWEARLPPAPRAAAGRGRGRAAGRRAGRRRHPGADPDDRHRGVAEPGRGRGPAAVPGPQARSRAPLRPGSTVSLTTS